MNAAKFLKVFEGLQYGSLHITTPEGKTHFFKGPGAGPDANFVIRNWSVVRHAAARGDIALGEDYIAGLWDTDNVEKLFSVFILNMDQLENYAHGDWVHRLFFAAYNAVVRRNDRRGSKANIKSHYDVGNNFYKLWLDETMTYSSALYNSADTPLHEAQKSKYNRILDKVGDAAANILEIGCGWGGFAETAAGQARQVTALTVSDAQHKFARERLGSKADIQLKDYRDSDGLFDAIVSIEMFEAVGEMYWPDYFKTVAARLKKGGKAVVQTITIRDELFNEYRLRGDFIRHYVFPGGMLPSLKRFEEEAAKAGLKCLESFSFGQDYARTLREWGDRFDAKHDEIKELGYSEAFMRNWRFYLGLCAAGFAMERTDVVQVELQHA